MLQTKAARSARRWTYGARVYRACRVGTVIPGPPYAPGTDQQRLASRSGPGWGGHPALFEVVAASESF